MEEPPVMEPGEAVMTEESRLTEAAMEEPAIAIEPHEASAGGKPAEGCMAETPVSAERRESMTAERSKMPRSAKSREAPVSAKPLRSAERGAGAKMGATKAATAKMATAKMTAAEMTAATERSVPAAAEVTTTAAAMPAALRQCTGGWKSESGCDHGDKSDLTAHVLTPMFETVAF